MTTKLGTAVVLALVLTQHAESGLITLSCDGTETVLEEAVEIPLRNVGLIANLDEQKVYFDGFVASISDINAADIAFSGRRTGDWFSGTINRVTGYMHMTVFVSIKEELRSKYLFDVRCKATEGPTKRGKLHAPSGDIRRV